MGMEYGELKQSRGPARIVEGFREQSVSLADELKSVEVALMRCLRAVRCDAHDVPNYAFAEAVSRDRIKLTEELQI